MLNMRPLRRTVQETCCVSFAGRRDSRRCSRYSACVPAPPATFRTWNRSPRPSRLAAVSAAYAATAAFLA